MGNSGDSNPETPSPSLYIYVLTATKLRILREKLGRHFLRAREGGGVRERQNRLEIR